jgi:hypothetical protein
MLALTGAFTGAALVTAERSEVDGCRRAERFCCENMIAGSQSAKRRETKPGNKNRFLTQPPKTLKIKIATDEVGLQE